MTILVSHNSQPKATSRRHLTQVIQLSWAFSWADPKRGPHNPSVFLEVYLFIRKIEKWVENYLWNCILKIFFWSNYVELFSQKISFEAKIVSSKHFLWGISIKLYFQNIFCEVILLSCILKIFLLRRLCGIVFLNFFLCDNFAKLYSHTLWQSTSRNCISTLWDNSAELYSHKFLKRLHPHVNKLMVTKWDIVFVSLKVLIPINWLINPRIFM